MGQTIRNQLHSYTGFAMQLAVQKQQDKDERDREMWLEEMPRTSEELELANRYKSELKALREAEALRNSGSELVATLVVNFGKNGRVLPGLITGEERPMPMLVAVLEALCERAGLLNKNATPSTPVNGGVPDSTNT